MDAHLRSDMPPAASLCLSPRPAPRFGLAVLWLAAGLTACSQQQVCDGVASSCLDLLVDGPADVARLQIDATLAGQTPVRMGQPLDLSAKLPRHILITPPPNVSAEELRSLRVTGYAQDDLAYVSPDLPLAWPEGGRISASLTLPSASQAPTVTQVEPALGASSGGQMVTITGRYFANPVQVSLGGVEAPIVNRVSPTELRVQTPARPGTLGAVDVAVTNQRSGTQATLKGGYSYYLGTLDIPTFSTAAAGSRPCDLVAADFDGDTISDLAVTNYGSNSISILRGNGAGGYTPAYELKGPSTQLVGPCSIVAMDLNADGYADLVVGNAGASHLSLFRGSKSGDFNPVADTVGTESGPASLAIADFDGDGKKDLAVANTGTGVTSVSVLRGNGAGGLTLVTNYDVVANAKQVAVGDLTGDNKPDILALTTSGTTSALALGVNTTTTGISFQTAQTTSLVVEYQSLSIFDADRDGDLDVALVRVGINKISIYRNNGSGAYSQADTIDSCNPTFPRGLITADINNDQNPDLITPCEAHSVAIHFGSATGKYTSSTTAGFPFYGTDLRPARVITLDANRDGITDLITANDGSANVSIIIGEAGGKFRDHQQIIFSPVQPFMIEIADINGDKIQDIVTGTNDTTSQVILSLGKGNGLFDVPVVLQTGSGPQWLALGDLNGGGSADLVCRTGTGDNVYVGLADGSGAFSSRPMVTGLSPVTQVLLRDVNADGLLDLMMLASTANRAVRVSLGNGDGTFKAGIDDGLNINDPTFFATADLNKDGKLDYGLISNNEGKIYIRYGDGTGAFTAGPTLTTNAAPSALVLADLTGDGHPDVLVSHAMDNSLLLFAGSATGPLASNSKNIGTGRRQNHVAVADFDGDRVLDLLLTSSVNNLVQLLRGLGGGSFAPGILITTPRAPAWTTPADLDGDGKLDFAVANQSDHTISLVFNRSR